MTYQPFQITGADRPGPFVITCDHATNIVPDSVNGGTLGLPQADMARHIAWDVGAEGVCLELGALLDAPVLASRFSRLVIDPNRGEDDPTLLMKLYDGTIIPGNRDADAAEIERRLNLFHRPYHAAYDALLDARPGAVIVAVHSFTPQLKGRPPRPWQIGLLSAGDRRFTDPFLARLKAEPDLTVGDNEPYLGHLPGDSIARHALPQGRQNTLIELRNDLITAPDDQVAWAKRLAPVLEEVRQSLHLEENARV